MHGGNWVGEGRVEKKEDGDQERGCGRRNGKLMRRGISESNWKLGEIPWSLCG